ncbi:MAG TPA: TIGR01906 family membrane protein [Bacillota bacterium]|nr:TIGR01906 family membrane protein [Bacillota bacterium]
MPKKLGLVLGIILALSVFVTLTTVSLHWQSYDLDYFEKSFVRFGIPQDMDVDLEELMSYAVLLTDYLRGDIDSPNTYTTARDRNGSLYGEREIVHLEDVRVLFDLSRSVERTALAVSLIIILMAVWKKQTVAVARGTLFGGLGIVTLLALMALMVASDFERYFIVFHELSFSNDLWMLDPNTELLIRMFPEPFFSGMAARITTALAVSYASFLGACFWVTSRDAMLKKGRSA